MLGLFCECWKKIALLVFLGLARVSAKTKCAICVLGLLSNEWQYLDKKRFNVYLSIVKRR
jgi:hypothetical protein